jgi:DNA sulfur modification protein DndC
VSKNQTSLFDDLRLTLDDSLDLTIRSLSAYAVDYRHWAIAYSGGKDSTALVTLVAALIADNRIPVPESLTVLYADTRQELPPLHVNAIRILQLLNERGVTARIVLPPMEKRFFVYMFGRGVPPPNNNTLRWCTRQLKIEPMLEALKDLRDTAGGKLLMLTGVRVGESAALAGVPRLGLAHALCAWLRISDLDGC